MGNTVTSSVRLTSHVTMLILVMLVLVTMATGQDSSCHLPAGDAGLCVDIAQCGHLTKLISNLQKPFPRDVSLLIRDSFLCGSSGTSVSVCCPRSGLVTPVTGQPETENFPAALSLSAPCRLGPGPSASPTASARPSSSSWSTSRERTPALVTVAVLSCGASLTQPGVAWTGGTS